MRVLNEMLYEILHKITNEKDTEKISRKCLDTILLFLKMGMTFVYLIVHDQKVNFIKIIHTLALVQFGNKT